MIDFLGLRNEDIWILTLVREDVADTTPANVWKKMEEIEPKAKRNIGQEILESIRQLKRGDRGRIMKVPSVTSIREKTGLSQLRFAELLGVSVPTLQDWEQGGRAPSGAARTLLVIAEKNPRALLEVAERIYPPEGVERPKASSIS